jgi:chemotaxis protein MotB
MADAAAAAAPEPAPGEGAEAKAAAASDEKAAAAEEAAPLAPIIVKKIIDEGHGGAHGGAWKIALADMMTAMMAFFLLMWLLGATNTDQRKGIADYFKPTSLTKSAITVNNTSGSTGLMGGQSIIDETALPQAAAQTGLMQVLQPRDSTGNRDSDKDKGELSQEEKARIASEADKANFEKLEKELKEKLSQDKDLSKLKENVVFSREKEGLRIEIIDKADFSMFGLGNTKLTAKSQGLIEEIARSLSGMPNKIKVRGHTDALAFKGSDRNNWSLSAERADVTRQIITQKGVDEKRIARIEGVADTEPFVASDPLDPRNRRISITVQYRE